MSLNSVDVVIVGQGLAGTVLAWQLLWRGRSVLVVDDPQPMTASRIAAGLITPITGQRLVPSWRLEEFWPVAKAFYRRVEEQLGRVLFREIPMVRLFETEKEQAKFFGRTDDLTPAMVRIREPLVDEKDFRNDLGGFEMTGGQLNLPVFLEASRESFEKAEAFVSGVLELPGDIELKPDSVAIPALGCEAERIVFCEGFRGRANPWFGRVPFDPAKGEMLTIRIRGLCEQRVIHRGLWLAHLEGDLFRVGATYDRENLDDRPTEDGRDEIRRRLALFLKRPFDIIEHHAAVRPIALGRHPLIGVHPRFPQLGYFNGLGSKGSLQAPFIAEQFARHLTEGEPIDDALDINQRFGGSIWND